MADTQIPAVVRVFEARDDKWGVEFDNGTMLHCAKNAAPGRIDALIERYATDPDCDQTHLARMKAMAEAIRNHETANSCGYT